MQNNEDVSPGSHALKTAVSAVEDVFTGGYSWRAVDVFSYGASLKIMNRINGQ